MMLEKGLDSVTSSGIFLECMGRSRTFDTKERFGFLNSLSGDEECFLLDGECSLNVKSNSVLLLGEKALIMGVVLWEGT
uniref:Uncharacterized protein n=1 Tax=Lepeophtheirus salmonis TaxID=72036 RepID=A0A0K2UD56_LEPSM